MRYTMSERHSYGNGFRKARAIGIRKLKHMNHNKDNYYNPGHHAKYNAVAQRHIKGGRGHFTAFK